MEGLLLALLQFIFELVLEIIGEIVGAIIEDIGEILEIVAEKTNLPIGFFRSDEIITLDILYQNKEDFNK